jgi:hypothetical protein
MHITRSRPGMDRMLFAFPEEIISADFTDVAKNKKLLRRQLSFLGLTREKSFCPKSLMINVSANRGNIYLRESA